MYTNDVYTVEDDNNKYDNYSDYSAYEDNINYQESSTRSGNNSLIIKIIIIIICIIALIWLILALRKNTNSNNNDSVHTENVEKVRLAAEKYFFLQDNIPSGNESKTASLNELINKDLVGEIVDANNKTCSKTQTFVTLNEEGNYYVLKVNLSCSTNDKQEVFHYSKNNYACIDCNGRTNMNGDTKPDEKKKENEPKEPVAKQDSYSCTTWSEWSDEKVVDSSLEERTRVVVIGVKKGSPIVSTSAVTPNSYLPLSTTSSCPSGYEETSDYRCLNQTKTRGDLTYSQYTSGDYKIYNKPCDSIDTEYHDGKYIMVYKGCLYSDYKVIKKSKPSSENKSSSNTSSNDTPNNPDETNDSSIIMGPDEYTKEYYEEKDLPVGYTKLAGSEKTQYSYKLKKCEK